MEHDGCVGCKYEHSSDDKYCNGCKQNAVDKYIPMMNMDIIKEMSAYELAEFLFNIEFFENDRGDNWFINFCLDGVNSVEIKNDVHEIKEWLESECDR